MSYILQSRDGSQWDNRKTESVSMKCTPEQKEKLLGIANHYATTSSDVLLQLIELAHQSISSQVSGDSTEECSVSEISNK